MIFNGLCEHLLAFASICERASRAFIFSSKSSDQICLASNEHFRKYLMSSSQHFVILTHVTREILTDAIDLYHTAAILSPRRTKSFVFARLASHWMRS